MTTYKEIFGKQIKQVSSDLTDEGAEGQIWFNTTDGVFKSAVAVDSWSSASPMTTARANVGPSSAGTQTASFVAGGTPYTGVTEEYNGSGWSAGGALNTPRGRLGGAGTLTAGLVFGGLSPSLVGDTEEYNGTSWSEQNNLNTPRRNVTGCGIQTAGLAISGVAGPGSNSNATEEYDGSSWTSTGNLPATSSQTGTAGIQGAALAFAFSTGSSPYNNNITCSYDGSSWTNLSLAMNTTRRNLTGAGSQNSALAIGGLVAPGTGKTELYNGTSWSEQADMSTARYELGGSGTSTAALAFAGTTGSVTSATEEYNFTANTVTAGAFSSLPTLNTARWGLGGAGTKSAAIVFGGRNPPVGLDLALSEEYNGTSWSEGPDLNTATRVCGRGTGTSTAALKHGGHAGSPSTSNKAAEEWNGSSWSNSGSSTNNHDGTMQIGTQTAAASCGSNPPTGAKTEEYNGTSWTASNDMPYSAYQGSASGSQTAGVVFGGGYPAKNNSAEYDGTNWTAGNTLIQTTVGQGGNGGSGTQALAIGAGGYTPGPTYLTSAFTYDGTNFATSPSLATARQEVAAQGANTSFYVAGGLTSPGAATNVVEEFTPESTTLNIKTLTNS